MKCFERCNRELAAQVAVDQVFRSDPAGQEDLGEIEEAVTEAAVIEAAVIEEVVIAVVATVEAAVAVATN